MSSNGNKQRVPFYCSWIVIVIAAVILWPLAVLLVWKRGQYDRKLGLNLGLLPHVSGVAAAGPQGCLSVYRITRKKSSFISPSPSFCIQNDTSPGGRGRF